MSAPTPLRRATMMLALVVAAEAVFALPFVIARVFRPTLLDVFQITNLQLGTAFSMYGVVAMLSYFPGGPLADRFSARRMMTAALLTTSAGGILFASVPPLGTLKALFAFWGLTTVLLFWASLIRATREWGGDDSQGKAYGILDGGRGLLAALLATVTVWIFSLLLPVDAAQATIEEREYALKAIIWIFTGLTFAGGVLVWFNIPDEEPAKAGEPEAAPGGAFDAAKILTVLRMPMVWLQGLIVICAYVGFKGTDDLALFARDAFGFDDVQAASVSTVSFWVRPLAAFGAGLLGDKIGSPQVILLAFATLVIGDSVIAAGLLDTSLPWVLYTAVVGISVAVYGLRGVYFALFNAAGVPMALTGTAVGLVSVIGYTPDVFMGPLMGFLTDRSPGALGHQHLFGVLALFAAVGFVATAAFMVLSRRAAARLDAAEDPGF